MSDNPDTIDTIVDDMLNEGHTGPADSLEWVQAKMMRRQKCLIG